MDGIGRGKKIELKPGGADIPVTKDNKEEYVLRYVRWLLVDSIHQQWDAFEKGVMTGKSLSQVLIAYNLLVLLTPIFP